ncbi:hybrid sensor histidine kinase/response regulator [bacterium]|nr:hybrid sensor histidine kinase/response regulator [bacterium]
MSRLLIVDDEPANIQALNGILREQGYAISVATSGLQALKVLNSIRPDLILLDVVMPELDGFETSERLKHSAEWRDIPIIFLTAKAAPRDIVRGFELGAVDYVAKPFHAHELLARVKTHLAMDRLRRENERLVRAESELARHRSVAEMVAGVAHELNTPLGIINTAAGLLTKWAGEPALEALKVTPEGKMLLDDLLDAGKLITRNASRAHKLVQDFKKVSVHQITDIREQADLAEVVRDTVHLFQVSAPRQSLQIEVINGLGEQPASWVGYPGSLSQVLLNLLSNAQAYGYPDGQPGKVEVRLDRDGEGYCLSVRDFGKGISAEHLPRVFDPFFTTGRARGGSGLGMSIVHTIVTAHMQGTIRLQSSPGEGTTVLIGLPQIVPES